MNDLTPEQLLDQTAELLIGPGASPLPKIDQEAAALLTACNSVLNSLALQQIAVPQHLLSDLSLFCRTNQGFGVPFAEVARRAIPISEGKAAEDALHTLSMALVAYAREVGPALEAIHRGESASTLLGALAEMELMRERICGYFGWSKIIIAAKARMLVDDRERIEAARPKLIKE